MPPIAKTPCRPTMGRMGFFHLGCRWVTRGAIAVLLASLAACGTANFGVSVPIGRHTGIGVSVGSDGRIGVGVGVSAGGGTVSVGTSGQLPVKNGEQTDAPEK